MGLVTMNEDDYGALIGKIAEFDGSIGRLYGLLEKISDLQDEATTGFSKREEMLLKRLEGIENLLAENSKRLE